MLRTDKEDFLMNNEVSVCYLARVKEGFEPLNKFLNSYKYFDAGYTHDLVIVFKGESPGGGYEEEALFSSVIHTSIYLSDQGYDITSYFEIANLVDSKYIFFVNTFGIIGSNQWLKKYVAVMKKECDIGIVGATGSWQSGYSPLYADLYKDIKVRGGMTAWLNRLIKYRQFPNPHIRTNAFLIKRNVFLDSYSKAIVTKEDAYEFEHGRNSLTNKILKVKLKAYIVGENSIGYDIESWNKSGIFWADNQDNLLILDNQTIDYEMGSLERKQYLSLCAWHDPRCILGLKSDYEVKKDHCNRSLVSEIAIEIIFMCKFIVKKLYVKMMG